MTEAKESTARMKTIAAQVVEHSYRPLYSRIRAREEFHRKMKYLIPALGRIRVLFRDPLYSRILGRGGVDMKYPIPLLGPDKSYARPQGEVPADAPCCELSLL